MSDHYRSLHNRGKDRLSANEDRDSLHRIGPRCGVEFLPTVLTQRQPHGRRSEIIFRRLRGLDLSVRDDDFRPNVNCRR
jgi:hypothetical protein